MSSKVRTVLLLFNDQHQRACWSHIYNPTDAQQQSFASQASIRNFFRVTELSDSNRDCSTSLTLDDIQTVIDFCENTAGLSTTAQLWRGHLFRPRRHADWMCAQKRPIEALFHVLEEYKTGQLKSLPSYLAIVPDDVFVHGANFRRAIRRNFPAHEPHVLAGCQLEFLKSSNITVPHWGFGSFFSRAALERLLIPLHCKSAANTAALTSASQRFVSLACERLAINAMGEHQFFDDGMTLGDLMVRYASLQKYSDAMSWNAGYCLSAEQALAYFVQHFRVGLTDAAILQIPLGDTNNTQKGYQPLTAHGSWDMKGQCKNEGEAQCSHDSIVCHSIGPNQMERITEKEI